MKRMLVLALVISSTLDLCAQNKWGWLGRLFGSESQKQEEVAKPAKEVEEKAPIRSTEGWSPKELQVLEEYMRGRPEMRGDKPTNREMDQPTRRDRDEDNDRDDDDRDKDKDREKQKDKNRGPGFDRDPGPDQDGDRGPNQGRGKGKGKGKGKGRGQDSDQGRPGGPKSLPPGLQKKLDRGGQLPPGWQKKLKVGEVLDSNVYSQSEKIPQNIFTQLPTQPSNTEILQVEDRVIRVMKDTQRILDVFGIGGNKE